MKSWEKAEAFCRHDQKIRAAHRYSQLQVKKDGPVGELKDKLRSLGKKLENVSVLMESEAKLQSQLLDLLDSVHATYKTRYLQAFDQVTGKCEQSRFEIEKLTDSRPSGPLPSSPSSMPWPAWTWTDSGVRSSLTTTGCSSRTWTATPWSGP